MTIYIFYFLISVIVAVLGCGLILLLTLKIIRKFPLTPRLEKIDAVIDTILLDNAFRRALMGPQRILPELRLTPGLTVLEIGPGPGMFTTAVAKSIFPNGSLTSLDIRPAFFYRIKKKLNIVGIHHVTLQKGNAEKLPFDDKRFDLVFFIGVLGEIENKNAALLEAYRVLKKGGSLSITELRFDPSYLSPDVVHKLATSAGFHLDSDYRRLLHHTQRFTAHK